MAGVSPASLGLREEEPRACWSVNRWPPRCHENTEMVVRRGDSRAEARPLGKRPGSPPRTPRPLPSPTLTASLRDPDTCGSSRAHGPGHSPPGRPHSPPLVLLCPGYEWTFRANAWAAGGRRLHSRLSSRRLTTWRARPRRNWWKPRMEGRAPRLAPCTPTATGLRDAGVLTQRAGRGHAGTAVDGAQRGPLAARGISDVLGARPRVFTLSALVRVCRAGPATELCPVPSRGHELTTGGMSTMLATSPYASQCRPGVRPARSHARSPCRKGQTAAGRGRGTDAGGHSSLP